MSSPRHLSASALLAGVALAAAAPATALPSDLRHVQSVTAREEWTATVDDGRLCVRSPARTDCVPLPASTIVQTVEPLAEGWIATGRTLVDGTVHLYLLRGGPGGTRLLPPLPRRPADQRGGPVLLLERGELRGVAWLEGADSQKLAVRAAAWDGAAWGEPETVSPAGEWPQVALAGAVLPDGRWLLTWTWHDGTDDETLYSVRGGDRWSDPRRILGDNEVFDILPTVTATSAGALAAWSRFDGKDYRGVVAFFDGSTWREVAEPPGRGVDVSSFTHLAGGTQLLYSSVVPESWHLLSLDPTGRPIDRLVVPAALDERPFVERSSEGALRLGWPGRGAPPPRRIETGPVEAVEGGLFRYMAFGDSITEGVRCEGNGYPERLPDSGYLNCAVNGCQVVNKGLGGEQTNQGLTRIQTVLDNQGPWEVVLLMEGTNDICFSGRTNQQVQNALNSMESQARIRGVDTLHMTLIDLNRRGVLSTTNEFPCPADLGREDNTSSNEMELRVKSLANLDQDTGYRWWANTRSNVDAPPNVSGEQYLCNDNNTQVPGPPNSCLDTYYANGGNDWGHPGCNGYARLAGEVRNGIVAKPAPSTVVLTEPIGTVFTSVPIFRWNKESPRDATWYELDVDGPSGSVYDEWFPETSGCSGSTGTCARSVGALSDGNYTWRVRGRNPHGRSAWVQASFTILTPPGAPSPVSPSGTIGDPRPVFEWTRESPVKADSYRIEVLDGQGATVSDTEWDAATVCAGSSCAAEPFADGLLLVDGSYSWRVRGINAAGEGGWSLLLSFQVSGTTGIFADGFESGDTSRWAQAIE